MVELKWIKVVGPYGNEYHAQGINKYEAYPTYREFYLLVETPNGERVNRFYGPLRVVKASAKEVELEAVRAALAL